MSYTILSTKTLNPPVKKELEQNGFVLMEANFIAIENIIDQQTIESINSIKDGDTIIFTSANAVEMVKDHIDHDIAINVFCISGKTKETVQSLLPKAIIIDAAAYGKKLAEKIIASAVKEVIFFCGDIRRDELPALLQQRNIAVEECTVYKTIQTPKQVNEQFDAVLFFSPSAVKSFFSLNRLNENVVCFSIGTTTADEIKNITSNKIIIADIPTQDHLALKIKTHFTNTVQC